MVVTRSSARGGVTKSGTPSTSSPVATPKTCDSHYIIVHGRRWRATDPLIPPSSLAELKHFLGKARAALRGSGKASTGDDFRKIQLARRRIAAAKQGLGERGKPEWWNDTRAGRCQRWEGALRELRELAN